VLWLHSRLQGAECMLLRLGADPALWLAVSVCSLPGTVRSGTKLRYQDRLIASTSEHTGKMPDENYYFYHCNIYIEGPNSWAIFSIRHSYHPDYTVLPVSPAPK